MLNNNRFFESVSSTAIASIMIMISGLITGSLIARLLGAEGRGELALIQLYGTLFASIAISGLPGAVTYYTGTSTANAGKYYLTGIAASIPIMFLGAISAYLIIPHFLATQPPVVVSAARFYLFIVPLNVVTAFCLASVQGQMKMLLWNLLRIIAAVSWLVPVSVIFFLPNIDAVFVSKIYLVFMFIYSCIFVWILVRSMPDKISFYPNFIKPLWKYAMPTSLATFSQQSNLKLDQIFISLLLPTEFLGLYVVAIAWTSAYSPLSNAVSYVIVPHLARLDTLENQKDALTKITRINLMLNFLLASFMVLVTPLALKILFGYQFVPAVTICYILLLGSILSNTKVVIAEGLRGIGKPGSVMKGELVGLVVSGLLFPLLLKTNGLVGVALASVVGYLVTFLLMLKQLCFFSQGHTIEFVLPHKEDFNYLFNKLLSYSRRVHRIS